MADVVIPMMTWRLTGIHLVLRAFLVMIQIKDQSFYNRPASLVLIELWQAMTDSTTWMRQVDP